MLSVVRNDAGYDELRTGPIIKITLQSFIPNYKINLITPKQIGDREFEKFQSDLGAVLLCAKHSKDKNLNILEQSIYKNLDRKTARLIKELTELDVDLDEYSDMEGSVDMCEAYENTKRQMIEIGKKRGIKIGKEDGIKIGKEDGIKIGKELGIKEVAINMKNMGFSIDMIAKVANISASMVEEWLDATTA